MPQKDPWTKDNIEPSLAEMLSDPVVEAMMRADGVEAVDVLAAIRQATRTRFFFPSGSFQRSGEITRGEAESRHQLVNQRERK